MFQPYKKPNIDKPNYNDPKCSTLDKSELPDSLTYRRANGIT